MCVVQLYNHSLVWIISASMFDIRLIFVGVELIVKGEHSSLVITYAIGCCMQIMVRHVGLGYRFKVSLTSPADPVAFDHLTYEALVPTYLYPTCYRLARWSSYVGQPNPSPSLISCLFQDQPEPLGVFLLLTGPVGHCSGYPVHRSPLS